MANKLEMVELGKIEENPMNNREMSKEEIENLKESISEVGLLHPLVVYQDEPDHYILISGHKRFRALKELGKSSMSQVQCTIVDKPKNSIIEQELMARGNVARRNPEEIMKEIDIANCIWNTMDSERRKNLTRVYKERFEEENSSNPLYINNPQSFISNRFRPRAIYINHITGLNLSNRSVSKYLKETLKKEKEGIDEEVAKKKEVQITIKKIVKNVKSLKELINAFEAAEGFIDLDLSELKSSLNRYLGEE